MNHELAKELKEAGFPQAHWSQFVDCADPTLSQLIEACGTRFSILGKSLIGFYAVADCENERLSSPYTDTPEEAVARLWLTLNAK